MTVTIVGTLEMIYTSGGEIVSEAVHVDFESPTDVPLPLHESIVFTERTPPVDIRVSLEAHLADGHGFTSVTRVPVSRTGAMAEWTAIRDGITRAIVLWSTAPLRQEGVEWGVTVAGDTRVEWAYQTIAIGDGAEATGDASIAVGYNAKSTEEFSSAMGHNAKATGKQSLALGSGSEAGADYSTAIGVDAQAVGRSSFAAGHGAEATGNDSVAMGNDAESGIGGVAIGVEARSHGVASTAVGYLSETESLNATAIGSNAGVGENSPSGSAFGLGAKVLDSSPRSTAISAFATVPADTPDTTVLGAKSLRVKPSSLASTLASTITLYDVAGNQHAIGVTPDALMFDGSPVPPATHNHDTRYYTQEQVDSLIAAAKPESNSNAANATIMIISAGDHPIPAAAVSVTGLTPGSTYKVTGTVAIRLAGGTSTAGQWGMQFTSSGTTTFFGVRSTDLPTAIQIGNFTWSEMCTVGSNGTITVTPCVRWGVGTISVTWASATITVL